MNLFYFQNFLYDFENLFVTSNLVYQSRSKYTSYSGHQMTDILFKEREKNASAILFIYQI